MTGTAVSAQPLITAIAAAVTAGGVAFGDGVRPGSATTRYVVAWFDAGTIDDRTLTSRDGFAVVGTFHAYGQTPEAARFANSVLTGALLGLHRQAVAGRLVRLPEQLTALPLQRDDNLSPSLFDVVSEWRIRTTPA